MDQKIQEITRRLEAKENQLKLESRKREAAEATLRKSRETLKRVMKEMPVIILATDKDGSIVFFNREFEQISGYSVEDMNDHPEFMKLLLPDETESSQDEQTSTREWRFINKNGIEKVVIWSAISMHPPILGWQTWKVGVDVSELQATRAKVKILSGLLPICASCKKIRDDKGYWNQIESYIRDFSEADFSHSICPDCAKELYPDLDIES